MAILNPDGTPFKLSDHDYKNPLPMSNWGEDYTLHNFNQWQTEVVEDPKKSILYKPIPKPVAKVVVDQKPLEIVRPKPVEQAPASEKEKPVPEVKEEKKETGLPNGITIDCLPAIVRQRRNPLDGQQYSTVQYSEPFKFEGVILEQDDMRIQIWTLSDRVTLSGILFPRNKDIRWWKVVTKHNYKGGFIFEGIPSEKQPHFAE